MSHPPRRYWEDNYQARARDVPDPEAGGGMSAEGQTILEALDELCSACAENPRVGRIPERIAALEARLAEAERRDCQKATDLVNAGLHARKLKGRLADLDRALRFYAESSDNYMTAQAALAGMTKEEFRAAEALRDAATQETGE